VPIDPRDLTPQGLPVGWSDARPGTFTLRGVLKAMGWAWAIGVLFLGFVTLTGGAGASGSTTPPAYSSSESPQAVDIATIAAGGCYNSEIDPGRGVAVPCSGYHDGEVLGTFSPPGAVGLGDDQLAGLCRTLLTPGAAAQLDQEALALDWSFSAGGDDVTCRVERGTHEPPLEGPVADL
jgi:hypothetical protein